MKVKTTNNPNGRPKGTGNILASAIREQIRSDINANNVIGTVFEKLSEIENPYKYIQTALSIIDIVLPRMPQEQPELPEDPLVNIINKFEKRWPQECSHCGEKYTG